MFVLTIAVAPFWMHAVGAVSALVTMFAFWKPAKPAPKVWGPEHDHEAEYQKLRARLGNGKH